MSFGGNKLRQMGRRRFVEAATALGLPMSNISLGTQKGFAAEIDDPEKEVSYVHRMKVKTDADGEPVGREPIYKTISRDRFVAVKATRRAEQRVSKILTHKVPGIRAVHPHPVEAKNSPIGYAVAVRKSSIEGSLATKTDRRPADIIKAALPETVSVSVGKGKWEESLQKIPVLFTEERNPGVSTSDVSTMEACTEDSGFVYKDNWDDIPGGCALAGHSNSVASGCAAFYNENKGETQLITAGHVVDAPSADWGNPTKSSSGGYVEKRILNGKRDMALLGTSSNTSIRSGIRDDTYMYTDLETYGSLTDFAIREDYVQGTKDAFFQGHKSGRVKSSVYRVVNEDKQNAQVHLNDAVKYGDSGGVIFGKTSSGDGAYIMGVINHCFTYRGDGGNTAEAIERNLPGYFR